MISDKEKRLRELEARVDALERDRSISFYFPRTKDDPGWWSRDGGAWPMYSEAVSANEALCSMLNRFKAAYKPKADGFVRFPEEEPK